MNFRSSNCAAPCGICGVPALWRSIATGSRSSATASRKEWPRARCRRNARSTRRGKYLFSVRQAELVQHADGLELGVAELAVLLLHPAHIDVLNDLPRFGIDHHRALGAVRVLPVAQELHRL